MSGVTVVLPVWDEYVGYLDETLAGLRAQTPGPRIIVVDNCSATELPAVAGADVIRTPRRISVGAARTYGLNQVATEFVLFWDADDIMPASTVRLLEASMRADPLLCLLATRIEEGGARRHHWPRGFTGHLARYPLVLAVMNSVSSQVPTIGALMRTEAVRDAGGFPDIETGDDWVLGVAMTFRGHVGVLDHVGRIYRQHGDSVWANRQTPAHLFEHARAVRCQMADDPAVPRSVKRGLPAIAVAQWLVIRGLRPLARRARG